MANIRKKSGLKNQLIIAFPKPESIDQNYQPDTSLFSRLLFDAGVDLINLEYELSKLDTLFQVLDRNSEDDLDQNFILSSFRSVLSRLQDPLKIISKHYSLFLDNTNLSGVDSFGFVCDLDYKLWELEKKII